MSKFAETSCTSSFSSSASIRDQLLGRRLLGHLDGRLRDHRQLGRLISIPAASIAWRTAESTSRGRGDLEDGAVAVDVVGTALSGGEHQLVLVGRVCVDEHDATPLEQPRDGPGRAQVAAVLGERVPYVRGGAVAVVGQRLDQDRDALRAIALVDDRLVRGCVGVGARAARDRALDRVLGHRVRLRLLDRVLEREVPPGSAPPPSPPR